MEGFVRLNKTLTDKGILVPTKELEDYLEAVVSKESDKDWYASLFTFGEEVKLQFEAEGSIKGYNGSAYTNNLVFDLDHEDLNKARNDVVKLLNLLSTKVGLGKEGIKNHVRVYFSGNKGFHVFVKTVKQYSSEELKEYCTAIAGELESFDPVIYNKTRCFRVANTVNQKSGLYKIPITLDLIKDAEGLDKIKELAKIPYYLIDSTVPLEDTSCIDQFVDYHRKHVNKKKSVVVPGDIKEVDGIRGLENIDFKKSKNIPKCIYALSQGIMIPGKGQRHEIFLHLGNFYRNQGHGPEVVQGILEGIAKMNAALYPDKDPYTKDEIKHQVVKMVFATEEAQNPGGWGVRPDNKVFANYCAVLSKECRCPIHDDRNKKSVVKIEEVANDFADFAANFEDNIIRTGIDFVDENMKIAIGTTTLLVGAAGCHRKGTEILMFDGTTKKVEDVKVGDRLMGPDQCPRNVLELKRGHEPMYEVRFTEGKNAKNEPKYYNATHKLYFLNIRKKMTTITVEDYVNNYSKWQKARNYIIRQPIAYKKQDLPVDPYLFGKWLGDGDSSQLDSNPRFEEVKHSKRISFFYKTSTIEDRQALLAGLFDVCGKHRVRRNWVICKKEKELANDIKSLCHSIGFNAILHPSEEPNSEGYYDVYFFGSIFHLPTKKSTSGNGRVPKKIPCKMLFTAAKVNDGEDYYGFTVDVDNLYLDAEYLVTRNSGKTSICLSALERLSKRNQKSMFFSLDMHRNLVYSKLAQRFTSYNQDDIFKFFKTKDMKKIQEIHEAVKDNYKNVYLDFTGGLSIDDMKQRIEATENKYGDKVDLVIVDYASRMKGPYSDRHQNESYNAMRSKDVADETDAAWIILNQISRTSGDGSTPLRSKRVAKGSGDWEESATNVLTVWRPFMGMHRKMDTDSGVEYRDDYMRIFLAKNRMGVELEDVLKWNGAKGTVSALSDVEREMYNKEMEPLEKAVLKAKFGR